MKTQRSGNLFIRIAKITGFSILGIVVLLAVLPLFLSKTINGKVTEWANANINGTVAFKDVNLSFFKHFPYLTVTLYQVDLKGSAPFEKENLLNAGEIALGVNVWSAFGDKISINKFYVDNALINIQTDSLGAANYNIYKSSSPADSTETMDTTSVSLGIELIKISNSHLVYHDRSLPMMIDAKGFNYQGKGDLMNAVFTLQTHARVDSLDFAYGDQQYLKNKKIDARLVTRINTHSLSFIFEKNDLKINDLPLTFTGKFAFLKSGYDMSFSVSSRQVALADFISALPPDYLRYVAGTKLKGTGSLTLTLNGQYNAEDQKMPDAAFGLSIQDGFIQHEKAPFPLENLALEMKANVPGLDPQKLDLAVNKVHFNIGKDYFDGSLKLNGLNPCTVDSKVQTQLNLAELDQALGLPDFDFRGLLHLDFSAKGKYATAIRKSGIRQVDTVIASIPAFTLKSRVSDGYFKYTALPEALKNISFDINASCADSNYKNTTAELTNINVNLLDNYLKGYIKVKDLNKFTVNADLKSVFDLQDIAKFYPLNGIELGGKLTVNAVANGTYEPKKHIFPVTVTELALKNGHFKTDAYPIPLNNIDLLTRVTSSKGSYKDLRIEILPVSFKVSQEPFLLKANLEDFNNLRYDIKSKGSVDLAKLYKIFGVSGYDLAGKIKTNLALKGRQSDAASGQYQKLDNKGMLEIKDMAVSSDLFPQAFLIRSGRFVFYREKMLFKSFTAQYGKTAFNMDGQLSNMLNYLTREGEPLKGDFKLSSDKLDINEFMAYAPVSSSAAPAPQQAVGVVLIPDNLDVNLSAAVKRVRYDDLNLDNFKGEAEVKDGQLFLKNTGFNVIGTTVNMNASYAPVNPRKANFTYDVKAENFDIQKAYQQIKLFREMASAAKDAYGTVSLNYKLEGKLDENMFPVLPSLKGNGTLSLNNIRFKGFKLMNSIARKTSSESLNDPSVSQVDIKTSISNNVMTIERTRMKIAGFRPRFEGQVSLDGRMNIGFRLGLPPFGIFGIPMKITGTQEKPVIKLGRQQKEDELQETTEN
ncbi:hypothetical protein FW774_04920 (plasmid) [Pedobacter sp. BS3]|uniref:AsmA family protein n=1 Tax=Pedobacter sp. BS3 TaxID=2567937 RepID=UPI0011ECA5A6|nr:AsmA-like C-terminal region-containing protein [Pedobacter sp. BS3]TZF86391.1 hypothetical protein FW774_04920 [Pedobacter sp. BS3]